MDDVFLPGVVDLFGDPIPRSRGKRGQPPHVPTAENRRFVQISLACGHGEEAIAEALRISTKTLSRHYFHELAGKRSARMRLEMKTMATLIEQVDKGNVSAASILFRKLAQIDQRAPQLPKPAKVRKLGKKEELLVAAREAGQATPWGPLLN